MVKYGVGDVDVEELAYGLQDAYRRLEFAFDNLPQADIKGGPLAVLSEVCNYLEQAVQAMLDVAHHAWPQVGIAPGLRSRIVENCRPAVMFFPGFDLDDLVQGFVNVGVNALLRGDSDPFDTFNEYLDSLEEMVRRPGVPAGSGLDAELERLAAEATSKLPPNGESRRRVERFIEAAKARLQGAQQAKEPTGVQTTEPAHKSEPCETRQVQRSKSRPGKQAPGRGGRRGGR